MNRQLLPAFKMLIFILFVLLVSCKKKILADTLSEVSPENEMPAKNTPHPAGLQTNLRMYGYMSVYNNQYVKYMDSVNLTQLTDVCISFINPDINGVFTVSSDIANAVVKAHNLSVNVHFAFGGGGGPIYWDDLIKPANRARVISNIRKVLTTYNFDGVDVDLENERITADYNGFVLQLSDTLRIYNKKLSIALSNYQRNQVSADVYSRLDFLNVMCYDSFQSGLKSHSSFAQFQTVFGNFKTKLPASKINMGVPGYAWEYEGDVRTTQVSFKNILKHVPEAAALNYAYPTATKSWWYDGHPILRQKVAYCLQEGAGGMMMWQIMHDPLEESTSLLKLMNFCAGNPEMSGFDPLESYSFQAKHSGMVMQVAGGSTDNMIGIEQNTWSNEAHQKWILQADDNEFKITNKNSGKVLNEAADGIDVQLVQSPWDGTENQRYKLVPNELGFYKIVNVSSSFLASVYQSLASPNTKIISSADINTDNQQWIINKY